MWLKIFCAVLLATCVIADNSNFWSDPLEYQEVTPVRPTDPEGLSFRLPNNSIPIHYDIWISTAIHEADFRFNGTVNLRFRTLKASTNITLNYRMMTIQNVDLLDANGIIIQNNLLTTFYEETGLFAVHPLVELPANQVFYFTITYQGVLRSDMLGFYRAYYIDVDGQQKWYATTTFQPHNARQAYPCFDEPQHRSSFTFHMRHHQSYHALGNTPIFTITPPDSFGYVTTNFEEVPSMHTYLLSFTVSDFTYVEDASVVPVQRIYGRRERINNGDADFALQESPKILKVCEEYYGSNFTFTKMDQIGLTAFIAGALENWALISYQEVFLFFDPLISTTLNRDNILRIIAHEFMHQWIGNILNPEWWTYLWINEGFATLDQHYLIHLIYPDERYMDSFLATQTQPVMVTDANPEIRHMSWYVESPMAIWELFDAISYQKAGSVLHTFQHAYGEATFKKGIQYLVQERAYNFHNAAFLYSNFQRAVNEDHAIGTVPNVALSLGSWETQAGFPLVTVSRSGNVLIISQERFMYDKHLHSDNLWWIPLNYVVGSNPDFSSTAFDFWQPAVRNMTLQSNTAPKPWEAWDWIIFNIQASSYIRVNYDQTLWQLLINQLNAPNRGFERIHYRNRAQLIDDAHHLARSARINFGIDLNLIQYMWQELDYVPWMAANRAFAFFTPRLSGSRVFEQYQEFIRITVQALFNHLGVQWIATEHRLDRFSRTIAMNLACRHQLPECLNKTNEELTASVFHGRRIEPEYRASIYCNGLRTGNALLFVSMQNLLLRTTGNQAERNNLIDGMACTQNSDLLQVHLNLAITPGVVLTTAERSRILTAPATNGEPSLWAMMEFIELKHSAIIAEGPTLLPTMLNSVSNNIASEASYSRFMLMMAELLCRNSITAEVFTQQMNNARTHLEWQSANIGDIEEFLNRKPF